MGENDNPKKPISMTVVACVESGVLEPLTIRMVDSLRRFGGRFANTEVVAVTPRLTRHDLGCRSLSVFFRFCGSAESTNRVSCCGSIGSKVNIPRSEQGSPHNIQIVRSPLPSEVGTSTFPKHP